MKDLFKSLRTVQSLILEWAVELELPCEYGNYLIYPNGDVLNSKGQLIMPHEIESRSGKKYLRICLYINKKRKRILLHRLVASCFLGPVEGLEVNHKDRDPLNCHVLNLEILTPSQNQKHWREDENG